MLKSLLALPKKKYSRKVQTLHKTGRKMFTEEL